jgi:hypothetical protein
MYTYFFFCNIKILYYSILMFQHHFKTDYKEKYLKYKNKYLKLKNQYGSSVSATEAESEYIYGDWEHVMDTEEGINKKFISLGYPADDNDNALFLNPKTNKFEKISDLVVFDKKDLKDNNLLADISLEQTLYLVENFLKNNAINNKASKDRYEQNILRKKMLREDREKQEAQLLKQQQKAEEERIAQLEEARIQREEMARKLEEADRARRATEEAQQAEIIRIKSVAGQAKSDSDEETNRLNADCDRLIDNKQCKTNTNCYYNFKNKKCLPKNDALQNIADRLAAVSEVKLVKIMDLEEEYDSLVNKKSRYYDECKEFNGKEPECNGQKVKGKNKCYYDKESGYCKIHAKQLSSFKSNFEKTQRILNELKAN